MTPSITQKAINIALGNFLQTVLALPNGQVVVGQVNRVAEPEGNFCVMWPLHRPRLATNVDTPVDNKFTGSIAGTVMTVSSIANGNVGVGNELFGVGVLPNTSITSQVSGPAGGIGTYNINTTQTLATRTLSAGTTDVAASTEVVMQVDIHGSNAEDNAQTVFQLFRDPYGVSQFEGTGISPLYADDPRQMPFIDAAKQYDNRWMVDVHLQITPVIGVPQEFADELSVNVVDVSELFPT